MQSASYNSVIGEIKRRLSITDLVGTYLSLKKSGKGYIGLCPFHDDNNPSLHVSEEKGLFHCFSCGTGGDIFGFVMKKKGVDFKDALEDLAKLADVKLTSNKKTNKKTSQQKLLLRLNKLVLTYFQNNLHSNSKAKKARK